MRHRCRCAVSRITRIRLFPLFFHNGCSQSSRFPTAGQGERSSGNEIADLGEKNGGVLSMRMQLILDSSFARPGSAPIWGGRKESSGTALGARRQSTNMFSLRSPLYAFVILCETAWKCGFRTARENYGKTFMKRSYTLAFPSNGKTIDEHVFMAFTVSNSVGKRLENAAFARSGKLLKNIQENKLFIVIFLVLDNMR